MTGVMELWDDNGMELCDEKSMDNCDNECHGALG